jgi:hypothetical protein
MLLLPWAPPYVPPSLARGRYLCVCSGAGSRIARSRHVSRAHGNRRRGPVDVSKAGGRRRPTHASHAGSRTRT